MAKPTKPLLILATIACIAHSAVSADTIRFGGSGNCLGTTRALAAAFQKLHPGIKVEIMPSLDSGGGIKAVLAGALDVGLSARPLKNEEREQGARIVEYARSPFVFAVAKSNPAANITTKELLAIYNGEMVTWPDGSRLRLVMRPRAESATKVLRKVAPGMDAAVDAALAREGMICAITDQENSRSIERISGAFGISTLAVIISEKRSLKALAFNGKKPSVKALADGTYPHFRPQCFVTGSKVSAASQKFIDFTFSAEGRKILAKNGCLPTGHK